MRGLKHDLKGPFHSLSSFVRVAAQIQGLSTQASFLTCVAIPNSFMHPFLILCILSVPASSPAFCGRWLLGGGCF